MEDYRALPTLKLADLEVADDSYDRIGGPPRYFSFYSSHLEGPGGEGEIGFTQNPAILEKSDIAQRVGGVLLAIERGIRYEFRRAGVLDPTDIANWDLEYITGKYEYNFRLAIGDVSGDHFGCHTFLYLKDARHGYRAGRYLARSYLSVQSFDQSNCGFSSRKRPMEDI